MKTHSRLVLFLAAATVAAWCSVTWGAAPADPPKSPPAAEEATKAPHIKVDSAPLKLVMQILHDSFGEDYVLPPELGDQAVTLDITSGDYPKVMEAVWAGTGGRVQYYFEIGRGKRVTILQPASPKGKSGNPFRINLDIEEGRFADKPGRRVPATVQRLVDYLREQMPELNIVLSPGAFDVPIQQLRLRSASLDDFLQALSFATDGQVSSRSLGNDGQGYALTVRSRPTPERIVEAFNLEAYLEARLAKAGPKAHQQRADQIQREVTQVKSIIQQTVAVENERSPELLT